MVYRYSRTPNWLFFVRRVDSTQWFVCCALLIWFGFFDSRVLQTSAWNKKQRDWINWTNKCQHKRENNHKKWQRYKCRSILQYFVSGSSTIIYWRQKKTRCAIPIQSMILNTNNLTHKVIIAAILHVNYLIIPSQWICRSFTYSTLFICLRCVFAYHQTQFQAIVRALYSNQTNGT